MDITYVKTTEDRLNSVPVIDGQEIYASDTSNRYSDFNGLRRRNVFGSEISAITDVYGAKNLLPYPYTETTKTAAGVVFTDNGDGSVTIDSSDKDETLQNPYMNIFSGFSFSPNRLVSDLFKTPGTYIISAENVRLQGFLTFSIQNYMDIEIHEESQTVTITDAMMNSRIAVLLWCAEKRNTPITIKPMIRDARITDPTYVPYAMTNRELTERVKVTKGTYTSDPNLANISVAKLDGYYLAGVTCNHVGGYLCSFSFHSSTDYYVVIADYDTTNNTVSFMKNFETELILTWIKE